MRASAVACFLSLGAVVSALPNVLNSWDLAQPIEERDVGTIECDAEPIFTGTLKLVSRAGRSKTAAFEGLRHSNGEQVLDVGKGGQSAYEEKFTFTSCNSPFMKYEPDFTKAAEVYFGRLRPLNFPQRCVSASELAVADARLVSSPCSESDDSSQMLQFWTLTKQPDLTGSEFTYSLSFPGQPRSDSPDFSGVYTFTTLQDGDNSLVKLQFNEADDAQSPYFFQLV